MAAVCFAWLSVCFAWLASLVAVLLAPGRVRLLRALWVP